MKKDSKNSCQNSNRISGVPHACSTLVDLPVLLDLRSFGAWKHIRLAYAAAVLNRDHRGSRHRLEIAPAQDVLLLAGWGQ